MVQGVEVDLFRPDDELKRLAKLAVELDVDGALATGSVDEALAAVAAEPRGSEWIAAWEAAQDPWFNFSSGNGIYSGDKVWLDHLEIPLGYLRDYIQRVRAGETIERPTAAVQAERDRITAEYRALLPDDERGQQALDEKLGLARLVFPYVENHNFYIEHWTMSLFWRKIRELGQVLADAGFWTEADDIFYLRRDELPRRDLRLRQRLGGGRRVRRPVPLAGRDRAPQADLDALERKAAAAGDERAARGRHRAVHDHALRHHDREREPAGCPVRRRRRRWSGMAASPGEVEGVARVVYRRVRARPGARTGEILVARDHRAELGAGVRARSAAVVTDIGGMMSHAAIVCREYGLPAVTGTGSATAAIKSGQRVRVDGSAGTVTVLD